MNRRRLGWLLVAIVLAFAFAFRRVGRGGWDDGDAWRGPVAPPRSTIEVKDATGVVVVLGMWPKRIVATLPGLADDVVAMGEGSHLVGISDRDEERPEAPNALRIPTWPTIPAERVAALSPDLLLVDPTLSPGDVDALRRRFPCTFACDSRSLDGLDWTFAALGAALGRDGEANGLREELRTARKTIHVLGRPRVLLLAQAEPTIVLGSGSLLDDMARSIGAWNVAYDLGRPSGEWSSEVVRSRYPEWIVLTGGTFPSALATRWADVPAVRDAHIVDASGDDFVRAGPRTAKALGRLADLLGGRAP